MTPEQLPAVGSTDSLCRAAQAAYNALQRAQMERGRNGQIVYRLQDDDADALRDALATVRSAGIRLTDPEEQSP